MNRRSKSEGIRQRGGAVARIVMPLHMEIGDYRALVDKANTSGESMQELVRTAVQRYLKMPAATTVGDTKGVQP